MNKTISEWALEFAYKVGNRDWMNSFHIFKEICLKKNIHPELIKKLEIDGFWIESDKELYFVDVPVSNTLFSKLQKGE